LHLQTMLPIQSHRPFAHRLLKWMSLVMVTLLFSAPTLMDSPSMPGRPSTLILSVRNFWNEAARGERGVEHIIAKCELSLVCCVREGGESVIRSLLESPCGCPAPIARTPSCCPPNPVPVLLVTHSPISIILSSTGLLQSTTKEKVFFCAGHSREGGVVFHGVQESSQRLGSSTGSVSTLLYMSCLLSGLLDLPADHGSYHRSW